MAPTVGSLASQSPRWGREPAPSGRRRPGRPGRRTAGSAAWGRWGNRRRRREDRAGSFPSRGRLTRAFDAPVDVGVDIALDTVANIALDTVVNIGRLGGCPTRSRLSVGVVRSSRRRGRGRVWRWSGANPGSDAHRAGKAQIGCSGRSLRQDHAVTTDAHGTPPSGRQAASTVRDSGTRHVTPATPRLGSPPARDREQPPGQPRPPTVNAAMASKQPARRHRAVVAPVDQPLDAVNPVEPPRLPAGSSRSARTKSEAAPEPTTSSLCRGRSEGGA